MDRRIAALRLAAAVTICVLALAGTRASLADTVRVAVASNFLPALVELQQGFENSSGHRLEISSASTGKLHAQISNGAPFDVLLAADVERPRRLEQAGLAVPGSRFTYALGRLVLWSRDRTLGADDCRSLLDAGATGRLAIANPATAPYGEAARQSLLALDVWEEVRGRLVFGENVGQTLHFVASGNARGGFVAASQLFADGLPAPACIWTVPRRLYRPVEQQAVLLTRAADKPAARDFLAYLRLGGGRNTIEARGYGLPPS